MEELPCPQRIPFDSGVAFSLGIVLGSGWNSIKGFRENPSRRWYGVKKMVRQNAPRLGGNFAAWGTLFSISECTLVGIRGTDDSINRIISGAVTSSLLAIRHGRGAMIRGAIIGGTLLGLIEGVTFAATRALSVDPSLYESEEQKEQYEQELKRREAQMKAQAALEKAKLASESLQPSSSPSPSSSSQSFSSSNDSDDYSVDLNAIDSNVAKEKKSSWW